MSPWLSLVVLDVAGEAHEGEQADDEQEPGGVAGNGLDHCSPAQAMPGVQVKRPPAQ